MEAGKIGSRRLFQWFILLFVLWANVLSAQTKTTPDTVRIGSYVISLHDINFHDKEYVMRFWVWMSYKNPEFDFTKRVEVPGAKDMEVQDVMTNTDSVTGEIWVLMKLKCTMKQSWKVGDFPFDKQKLQVKIENSEFDTRSLVFVPDTTGAHYDPELTVDGWDIQHFNTVVQNSRYETDFGDKSLGKDESYYAGYVINLELHRNAWGLFFKIFVGMYIAFMIAFISFYVDHEDVDPRFALPVGGLFGSIGNKYIIDNSLPETTSFTMVDSLHAMSFVCIFIILAVSVYTLRIFDTGQKDRARYLDRIARNVIMTIYLTVNFVLILIAIIG